MNVVRELKWLAAIALLIGNAGCSSVPRHETVTDIDGNVYQTVRIGDQVWMKENLRTTRYQDGTPIAHVPEATTWRHTDQPAYVWQENDESNKEIYGALYNWYAAARPELCPPGWRVPTDEDFKQLELYLGMTLEAAEGTAWRGTDQGGKLKTTGTELWESPNEGATNESGFSAVPSGRRWTNGGFGDLGKGGTFWTRTERSLSSACYRHTASGNAGIGRNPAGDKKFGYAIRCIRSDEQ